MANEELFEEEKDKGEPEGGQSGDAGWWRDFCVALHLQSGRRFGLDLPLSRMDEVSALRGFPLAGLLIGLAASLAYLIAHWMGLLPFAASVIGVMTLLWLTRAQEETRFALFTIGERGDDDSAVWPVSLSLVACATLLLKVALLSAVTDVTAAMAILITASLASRGALVFVPARFDPVGETEMVQETEKTGRWFSVVLMILLTILFLGFWDAVLTLVVLALVVSVTLMFVAPRAESGARTTAGLVQQMAEIAVLLIAAATY